MNEKDLVSDIRYSYGDELKDKKILLIVTGSVAAYKIPDLIRLLIRHGGEVYVLPSIESLKYVTLDALKWSSGGRVIDKFSYRAEHINLIKDMDLVAVIPATANIIAKAANGIADTDASLAIHSALGFKKPVLMAPVMHLNMYENPILQKKIKELQELGVKFIEPFIEEEKAKLREFNDIKMEVFKELYPNILENLKILVTAGPTIEYIDPVRLITNKSSGRMGVYIAEEAYLYGAQVKLIAGNISVEPYRKLDVSYVETTEEMYEKVMEELSSKYDIFISASAPVDFRPSDKINSKINTYSAGKLDLELILTPKIVSEARKKFRDIYIVSFKALYNVSDEELYNKAVEHLKRYGFEMVVANDVGRKGVGFKSEFNEVLIVNREGDVIYRGRGSKRIIARKLLNLIAEDFRR